VSNDNALYTSDFLVNLTVAGPNGLRSLARENGINPKLRKADLLSALFALRTAPEETEETPETAEAVPEETPTETPEETEETPTETPEETEETPTETPEETPAAKKPFKWNNNAIIAGTADLVNALAEVLAVPATVREIFAVFEAADIAIRPGAIVSRLGTYTRRGLFVKTVETENGRKVGYYALSPDYDSELFARRFAKVPAPPAVSAESTPEAVAA